MTDPPVQPGDVVTWVDFTPDQAFGGGHFTMLVSDVGVDELGQPTYTAWTDPQEQQ